MLSAYAPQRDYVLPSRGAFLFVLVPRLWVLHSRVVPEIRLLTVISVLPHRHIGIRIKGALIAAIYNKALSVDLTASKEGVGKLNNLMSVDVSVSAAVIYCGCPEVCFFGAESQDRASLLCLPLRIFGCL
jgi:hypothetical protein